MGQIMKKQSDLLKLLQAAGVDLSDIELAGIDKCFGKRGAYKGWLTKNPPSSIKHPLANAIYNTIQPNAYKIQVYSLMFISQECIETCNKLKPFKYPTWLDLDMTQLKTMGAW